MGTLGSGQTLGLLENFLVSIRDSIYGNIVILLPVFITFYDRVHRPMQRLGPGATLLYLITLVSLICIIGKNSHVSSRDLGL